MSNRFKKLAVPMLLPLFMAACGGGGSGASSAPSASANGNSLSSSAVGVGGTAGSAQTIASLTDVGRKGKTYYVAMNGSDNADGASLSTPFLTLTKAVNIVNPGDVIEVRGGTYAGTTIQRPGTPDAWIKLESYNGEHVVIDGTGREEDIYFYQNNFAPMYWILNGVELVNANYYELKIDTPFVRIVKNNIHGSPDDLVKVVGTAHDIVIYGNELHHNNAPNGANAQGVDMVGVVNAWIADNYVHDIPSIGLYAKGGSQNIVYENNRVENIYERGIMLGQSTGQAFMNNGPYESFDSIIRNNIIINTQDACLATASSLNIKIYNNSCFNAATGAHGAIFVSNEAESGQAGTNIDIKDNIIYTSTQTARAAISIGPKAMTDNSTLHIDGNIYWSANGAAAVTFLWEDRNLFNVPIDVWRTATGMDASSIVADPQYASTTDLTLSPTSPAIDAGLPDSVSTDYVGNKRPFGKGIDIGAYEFGSNP